MLTCCHKLLQAVCNNSMAFVDCYAGEVGSVHDSCVLRCSSLFQKLQPGSPYIPADMHLVGDPAYPLMQRLLVPFKDTGRLGGREHKFNRCLSSARCTIERAFALLKGRFRRLKSLNMTRTDSVPKVVVACCVLHNICLQQQDDIEADDDTDSTVAAAANDGETSASVSVSSADHRAGIRKRDDIADMLSVRSQ